MRIAIIGCGNIGGEIVRAVCGGRLKSNVTALMDRYPEKCFHLALILEKSTGLRPVVAEGIEDLLEVKPDLVVEAASQEAVRQYARRILERGIDLVVMSVGALLNEEFLQEVSSLDGRIYVPSGAIAGLDAVRAMRHSGITRIVLRTRKNPRSLGMKLEERKVLFEGPASRAVKEFPFNVNVAAALSLAAGREAWVQVIADPGVEMNVHELEIVSDASTLRVAVENRPSPSNPRTSYLACLSAVELLRSLEDKVRVGT